MKRVLLDTSVLIGAQDPGELEGAISAASIVDLAIIDDLVSVQALR